MNPTTHNLTVRGIKLRTRTPRRWAVVAVRPHPIAVDGYTYPAFARVEKRTDNLETARRTQRSYGFYKGCFAVIIDLVTGEEVQ